MYATHLSMGELIFSYMGVNHLMYVLGICKSRLRQNVSSWITECGSVGECM